MTIPHWYVLLMLCTLPFVATSAERSGSYDEDAPGRALQGALTICVAMAWPLFVLAAGLFALAWLVGWLGHRLSRVLP